MEDDQHPVWYLLYGGTSPDGRGVAHYEGRTTDPAIAQAHHEAVKGNPYSTGCVMEVTDTEGRHVMANETIDP